MNMVRTDSKLKGVTVKQYKDFMGDTDKIKNDKSIKEFRIIEEFPPDRKIYYMEMNVPLMNNRTTLLNLTLNDKLDDGKQVLMLSQSIERDDVPEEKGKIRMHILGSGLARMEGDYLHITEFMQMDMKGYIPSSLMNMVLSEMAQQQVVEFYKTL